MENFREIKSFVKRASRISPYQKEAIENLSQYFIIKSDDILSLSSKNLFDNDKDFIIEIGFGMGDATYQIALENREKNYLGFEVHTPGIGRLLSKIKDYKLLNIKIVDGDAKYIITNLKPLSCIDGFHIFFPDPWHKKRHNKRRLVNDNFTKILVDSLKKDGYILFVSDCEEYALEVIKILESFPNLKNESNPNYERLDWRPFTKFENKALEKKSKIFDIIFRKEF